MTRVPYSRHFVGPGNGRTPRTTKSIMGTLYRAICARRWDRDRRRRIAAMLERERESSAAGLAWVEVMAAQLAEIWALPEAPDPAAMSRPARSKPRGDFHLKERLEDQDDIRHSTCS